MKGMTHEEIVRHTQTSVDWKGIPLPWPYLRGLAAADVAARGNWYEMVNWCMAMATSIIGATWDEDNPPSPLDALHLANGLIGKQLRFGDLSKRKGYVAKHATFFDTRKRDGVKRMGAARREHADPIPLDPMGRGA